ncbi:hypothetical protein Tco_0403539 [Tanacetum coccineum]
MHDANLPRELLIKTWITRTTSSPQKIYFSRTACTTRYFELISEQSLKMLSIQNSKSLILHQQRTPQLLKQKKLIQTQKEHSHPIPALNVDSLKVDFVVIQNTCSEKEDSNSETVPNKLVKECNLNSETKDVHAIKYKITRIEHDSKLEFDVTLGQGCETIHSTMPPYSRSTTESNLTKIEFRRWIHGKVLLDGKQPVPKFINSSFTLDYDSQIQTLTLLNTLTRGIVLRTSQDLVGHNHYLDEAKKKTQERDRDSKTSVMPSARFQSTADGSKLKPRSTNHSTRSLLCVFNANHDACITKLLKEVNSRAKIQSHKTKNSKKPVDQKSHTQKPGSQIFTGHRFSSNKTSVVYEKTSPRSDLRWKPTGRIFKYVGLRWIPTGKILASCSSKNDSEPTYGSNVDIPNIHKSKQTLDLSACTSINVQKEQSFDLSVGTSNNVNSDNLRVWLLEKLISQKPVMKWIQN